MRTMQAYGHVTSRSVQTSGDLVGGEILNIAEPHDLAERGRQLIDHFEQKVGQLAGVGCRLRRIPTGSRLRCLSGGGAGAVQGVGEGHLARPRSCAVQGFVSHNRGDPTTCGGGALRDPLIYHTDQEEEPGRRGRFHT